MSEIAEENPACGGTGQFISLALNLRVNAKAFSPHAAAADTENTLYIASEKITSSCIFFSFFFKIFFLASGGTLHDIQMPCEMAYLH